MPRRPRAGTSQAAGGTPRCPALLRGVNVGGRHVLPMQSLTAILGEAGARDVATTLQSGNAAFRYGRRDLAQFGARAAGMIAARHGFMPEVLVITVAALSAAMAGNPFPEAESAPDGVHLGFLAAPPRRPDLDGLERLRKADERFVLGRRVFYLHAPDGIGRSRLAANAERLLGVTMTSRNWRTVCRIRALLDA
ncbi:MAG: DUF1697 domain-containing protein [Gammaproteobacteria bacterium]|nr:DUF1697 domain-containing protein [Gammaproteobacteria bacterium]MBI5616145.1 DUF1697 domain-containing protein [Gammaproteobacteria bacterium]